MRETKEKSREALRGREKKERDIITRTNKH
jgi:hypothetical protein